MSSRCAVSSWSRVSSRAPRSVSRCHLASPSTTAIRSSAIALAALASADSCSSAPPVTASECDCAARATASPSRAARHSPSSVRTSRPRETMIACPIASPCRRSSAASALADCAFSLASDAWTRHEWLPPGGQKRIRGVGVGRAWRGLLGLIRARWGLIGAHWGSLGLIGAHWGAMGLIGAQWSSLELIGAQWGLLGLMNGGSWCECSAQPLHLLPRAHQLLDGGIGPLLRRRQLPLQRLQPLLRLDHAPARLRR